MAGLAATRRTSEQLATIQALAETMRLAEDDIDTYVQADIAFHLEIARASHNTAQLQSVEFGHTYLFESE